MSLGAPIHALNMQTNVNANRYFFATQEAGEQELFLSTLSGGGPRGNISSMAVGISGPAGNAVVVSEAPTFIASEFVSADQGVAVAGSTYWTLSTLSTSYSGLSLSSDRIPGTGIATIESYRANGSTGGIEFLSRGLNSALLSTGSVTDNYLSSIGRPGATAVLGASGVFVTKNLKGQLFDANVPPATSGGQGVYQINDLSGVGGVTPQLRWAIGTSGVPTGSNAGSDYALFSYGDAGNFITSPYQVRRSDGAMNINNLSSVNAAPYPQNLLSTVLSGTQGVVATSNAVTVLFSHSSANTSNMLTSSFYLVDVGANIATGAPGGSGAWLDLGVRLGGNGSFNYVQSMFIPPGGTPTQGVGQGVVQICDMGSANKNLDIVGYLQGVASLSISTSQTVGGVPAYMKMMT
jgi:hypothetical protein